MTSRLLFSLSFVAVITFSIYSQEATIADLPPGIKAQIIAAVGQSKNIPEVIKTLSTLARVNTTFNQLVKDPAIKKWILNNLSQKQDLSQVLATAISSGDKSTVNFLLDLGANTNNLPNKQSILASAVKHGMPKLVKILLTNSEAIHQGASELRQLYKEANQAGHTDIARILREKLQQITTQRMTTK